MGAKLALLIAPCYCFVTYKLLGITDVSQQDKNWN